MARTHGWSGNPPRTDNEAVAQILEHDPPMPESKGEPDNRYRGGS